MRSCGDRGRRIWELERMKHFLLLASAAAVLLVAGAFDPARRSVYLFFAFLAFAGFAYAYYAGNSNGST